MSNGFGSTGNKVDELRQKFRLAIENARKYLATLPEWKRQWLREAFTSTGTLKEPRKIIVNDSEE